MTKRKTKILIDVICILLVIMPIIFIALGCIGIKNSTEFDISAFSRRVFDSTVISARLRDKVYSALDGLNIFWYASASRSSFEVGFVTIVSNALMIYMGRVFIGVMVWLPKFASKLLERWCDI